MVDAPRGRATACSAHLDSDSAAIQDVSLPASTRRPSRVSRGSVAAVEKKGSHPAGRRGPLGGVTESMVMGWLERILRF